MHLAFSFASYDQCLSQLPGLKLPKQQCALLSGRFWLQRLWTEQQQPSSTVIWQVIPSIAACAAVHTFPRHAVRPKCDARLGSTLATQSNYKCLRGSALHAAYPGSPAQVPGVRLGCSMCIVDAYQLYFRIVAADWRPKNLGTLLSFLRLQALQELSFGCNRCSSIACCSLAIQMLSVLCSSDQCQATFISWRASQRKFAILMWLFAWASN